MREVRPDVGRARGLRETPSVVADEPKRNRVRRGLVCGDAALQVFKRELCENGVAKGRLPVAVYSPEPPRVECSGERAVCEIRVRRSGASKDVSNVAGVQAVRPKREIGRAHV